MTGSTALATIAVRPWSSIMGRQDNCSVLSALDGPPRSRLYGPVPCEMGTIWTESLTSYVNHLGWVYRVSPRELVAQELVPHVAASYSSPQLTAFCRQTAMSLNGNGGLAREWSTLLERLTGQADLHLLTLYGWIGNLSSRGHLRAMPTWCPVCYAKWREQGFRIYQSLLWQYQVVSICPQHQRRLETRCPQCHRPQSVITVNRLQPGVCTQCGAWLGAEAETRSERVSEDETVWQHWVIQALEELFRASFEASPLQWEQFFTGLAPCLQEQGAYSRLERLTGMGRTLFYRWQSTPLAPYSYTPSLETILEFCYACGVTPLQIMGNQLASLRDLIQRGIALRPARPRRPASARIDRQKCLELIQAILDGREEPLSIRQLAKRLGYGEHALTDHFPQECAFITKMTQEYRKQRQKQRLEQACDQVRQAMMTLHAQGIYPSHRKLRALLPIGLMRMPEATITWHEVLRELGLDMR